MGEEKSIPNQNSEDKNSELKKETNSQHFPEDSHAPKQATETMEVHHHGHVHEKKKWKEYLFQFLMLFLAVFCGFLAEYQLEQVLTGKLQSNK